MPRELDVTIRFDVLGFISGVYRAMWALCEFEARENGWKFCRLDGKA